MENKKDIRIERLEKLKQATIMNYTDRINYNNKLDLYDTMIESLLKGELDDVFLTDNISVNDKETFKLAQKYSSLLFFRGSSSYWLDSVEGVYSSDDPDLVVSKILDNYDFLLKIAKDTSEDTLKELVCFQNTESFRDKVIIDYLRTAFINDDKLISTIKSMSEKDGEYKDFSIDQKALLCLYPRGVIYNVNDKKEIEDISPKELISKIKVGLLGEDNPNFHLGDALKHMNMEDFKDIIYNIYIDDYKEDNVSKK